MSESFPVHSQLAKRGDRGVAVVSRIVTENFGWLFVKRHQEDDFGIDGQLECVTEQGHVTGQAFAVQIKYGKSFFQEKNRWGYVYRGERRHFNYLSNHPLIVLVLLVHPDNECYWAVFDPAATESTAKSWKLTVPFRNRLADSKQALEQLLGPARDNFAELEAYWEMNKQLKDAAWILLILHRKEDVGRQDMTFPRLLFDRMLVSRELAAACQGKVEISFSGYENDRRELFEIPEVRKYVEALERALPELFFFHRTEQPTFGLQAIALCLTSNEWPDGRSTAEVTRRITFGVRELVDFFERHWVGLNRLTDWLEMSEDENMRISHAVGRCLGLPAIDEGTPRT
jgi:hypothetical protein